MYWTYSIKLIQKPFTRNHIDRIQNKSDSVKAIDRSRVLRYINGINSVKDDVPIANSPVVCPLLVKLKMIHIKKKQPKVANNKMLKNVMFRIKVKTDKTNTLKRGISLLSLNFVFTECIIEVFAKKTVIESIKTIVNDK